MKKTSIQLKLLAAGIAQTEIAEATSLTQRTVCDTVRNLGYNQIVQEYVARVLGISPERLWQTDYAPFRRKRKKHLKNEFSQPASKTG